MIETRGKRNEDRQKDDFYSTNPNSVLDIIKLENLKNMSILENSAGMGHIVKELEKFNNNVFAIDIMDRGFKLDRKENFLLFNEKLKFDCAVYNPPFKSLKEFVIHTFRFTDIQYVFCRLQVLEGISRFKELYSKNYLEKVYVYSKRTTCAKDGKELYYGKSNTIAFCWLKFNKNNKNKTIMEWISFN